ncbi:MAG: efflux RND transporter periplasmic adaptor subunit [Acidobacteria bacterium]|nr:efflux RND transporter periplasmic adaptor subunit [Candidatus Sulfomarinibacter sp. MAG AM2]
MSSKTLKIVLPIIVLLAGVAGAKLLGSFRKAPPRVERAAPGPLVEVLAAGLTNVPIVVEGHGEVVAKVAVEVVPQVAGRVVEVSPSMVAGGFFKANQTLFVIEPRDYELGVDRSQAAVARAEVQLEREMAEAEVALQEWDELNPGEAPSSGLVVREPQVRQAKAELEAAKADLAVAQLKLDRTRASVPFDGVVVSETVDLGQIVTTGRALATVYGTDMVEVRVPLERGELGWFDIPNGSGQKGPRAEVSSVVGGTRHTWEGRVVRMEAQLDATSRMAHVVVEVARPFAGGNGRPPLMPNTFVDIRIFGSTLDGVLPLPRHALRDGEKVWVFDDGSLRILDVDVARADRERVYVSAGLVEGDEVIISALDAVTDGMKVRAAGGEGSESPTGGGK